MTPHHTAHTVDPRTDIFHVTAINLIIYFSPQIALQSQTFNLRI